MFTQLNIVRAKEIHNPDMEMAFFKWRRLMQYFFQQTQNKRIFDDAILLSNIHMLSTFIYVFPRVVFTDSDLTINTFAGLR